MVISQRLSQLIKYSQVFPINITRHLFQFQCLDDKTSLKVYNIMYISHVTSTTLHHLVCMCIDIQPSDVIQSIL